MAHHHSAKKSIRQNAKRTLVNRSRKSRIHTFVKKVELAIGSGNKTSAQEALRAAQSELAQGVKKGLLSLNKASRKVSRLSARIKLLAA